MNKIVKMNRMNKQAAATIKAATDFEVKITTQRSFEVTVGTLPFEVMIQGNLTYSVSGFEDITEVTSLGQLVDNFLSLQVLLADL